MGHVSLESLVGMVGLMGLVGLVGLVGMVGQISGMYLLSFKQNLAAKHKPSRDHEIF